MSEIDLMILPQTAILVSGEYDSAAQYWERITSG
jgi:hypothetical protein